jgi:hypothetical protein
MSDKKTYAHGFGGMNTDTPVHPKVKAQTVNLQPTPELSYRRWTRR